MQITQIETFFVQVAPHLRTWLFVKVSTDEGIHGWGEGTLEGKEETVAAAVHNYSTQHGIIGMDPRQIERIWQIQYRHGFWRGGVVLNSAISAIDQALWDITGKLAQLPVYQLLGGACRDRMQLYTHCHVSASPEQTRADLQAFIDAGWTALKTGSFARTTTSVEAAVIREAVAQVAAIRDVVGEEIELLVDHHGRTRASVTCRLLDALAPYHLGWFEEPVTPEDADGLRQVMHFPHTMDIATGERLFSIWEFRDLIEQKMADVIQPDICHAGGITSLKKIAAMAEAHHIQVAPHNPNGPVATAASIHLAAAIPNFRILECANQLSEPGMAAIQTMRLPIAAGWCELPTRPGLGIDLDEEALRRYATKPTTYYPGVFEQDGTPVNV